MNSKDAEKFTLTLVNSQYFLLEVKDNVEFEMEDAHLLVEFQKELGGGKKYPVVLLPSPTSTTNSTVLKHLAKKDSLPYTIADAFIVASMTQKILAKLYISFVTPVRPTQFFTRKEEALKWIEQYIEK